MKKSLLSIFLLAGIVSKSQTLTAISVNLYTDSLKKGTYNYINIDGLLSNGRYIPLDTAQISLTATAGVFHGNSLWIDPGFNGEKITIHAVVRNNPALWKEFDMYIKKKPDEEQLKTVDEILNEMNAGHQGQKKKKKG